MSAPTRVAFTMTEELAIEATILSHLHDPGLKSAFRTSRILSAFLFGYGLIGAVSLYAFGEATEIAGLAILFSFSFLAALLLPTKRKTSDAVRGQLEKLIEADPAYGLTLGPRVIEIGPEGISSVAPHVRTAWPFHAVVRTIRNRDWYVMVTVGPTVIAVPREGFATRDDFEQFATAADARIAANDGKTGVSER